MRKDKECPCYFCEKQGCGAFHDKCKEYQAFVERKEKKKKQMEFKPSGRTYLPETTFRSRIKKKR